MSTLNTLLIGSGRLARHLQHWSKLNKVSEHSISLSQAQPQYQPNSKLMTWNRSESFELLKKYLESADLIWLAISDKAIVPFFEEHLKNTKAKVVHFSGALYEPGIYGLHPLMSFPEELLENEIYGRVYFAVDESVENLNEFLPGFENSFFKIPANQKALYHALCVSAGNFPQILWSLALKEFRSLNVPDQAVELYLNQITELFISLKEKSLTGPLVRDDLVTIEKNINALNSNPSLSEIYKTFAGVYKNEK